MDISRITCVALAPLCLAVGLPLAASAQDGASPQAQQSQPLPRTTIDTRTTDDTRVQTTTTYNDRDIDRTYDESDYFGPQGGEWEITLAGAGSSDKDFESGGFNIEADLSTYASEAFSYGVRQNVGFVDNAESSWNGSTALFGQLHLGDTPLRPFVGLAVGYLYGDDVSDTFFGGPEAGLRYYVKPEAFIFGRAQYQFLFESGDEIDDQFDDGRFLYTVGVGFTF